VRTLPVEEGALPRSFELSGKVVMDPNAGGKVQALIAGRLEPGPRGFPSLGQRVNKGEVLAWVVPSTGMIERSNQSAQLAELRAAKGLAEKRLTRLKELADTIPRKEIEAAESEIDSLNGRIAALGAGLSNRDALVAPVSGVVAMSNAVAGQVVEAREAVFEVVDPNRSARRGAGLRHRTGPGRGVRQPGGGRCAGAAGLRRRCPQPARTGLAADVPWRGQCLGQPGGGPAGQGLSR
jgi:cobalt-zinc-cadmium efflux system membrane fusion protein